MFAKIPKNKKVFEMVKSLYGNRCDSMIRPLVKYQKKDIEFDVMWSNETHTAIGYELPDLVYDFYMLNTCDLEFGESKECR